MYSLMKRAFKFIQSSAHAVLNKYENPINLAEQGIRDLKKDYDDSIRGLAEVKAITITLKRELGEKKQLATDYEKKALMLLQNAKNGTLSQEEADRLASEAINKKQNAINDSVRLAGSIKNNEVMCQNMESKIIALKNQISSWESELTTMKARYKVAKSTQRINKQLASIGSDSTTAMLADMKTKVQEEEALAIAYDEMIYLESDIDKEINKAVGTAYSSDVQASLAELKSKLLENNPPKQAIEDNLADKKSKLE